MTKRDASVNIIQPSTQKVEFFSRPDGHTIAYQSTGDEKNGTGCVFFSGFLSDMMGKKVHNLTAWSQETGRSFLAFDHFAQGLSTGDFTQISLQRMIEDALALLKSRFSKPQVLIGSSMGGWIAYQIARLYPEYASGLIMLAPAFNFTKYFRESLHASLKQELKDKGFCIIDYAEKSLKIKDTFFQEAIFDVDVDAMETRKMPSHRIGCPVHILHAIDDEVIPWQRSMTFLKCFQAPSVELTLLKGGDHRLSSPRALRVMRSHLLMMLDEGAGEDGT